MASNVDPPDAAAAAVHSRVNKSTIVSAVTALLKYKAAQSATQKLQLLPQDDYIYLNLTLKKLPSNPRTNPFKIPLPHPILDATSQICLIIDDRQKSPTPPSDQIKKLIKSQNIPISKVIKISKLKTNYKPFEAKRKLCDSFDLFLVDKRVVHLLPKLLGKQFFKRKKLPLGVDLGKKNLKLQVERALGSGLLYVRTGTCCVMKVGKMEMEKDGIVENVFDAIKGAVERVGRKWDGVRSLHLKLCDSVALPVYQAMPDVRLKIEGLKEREERAGLVKISDNEGEVEERSKEGKSGKKKKKGRIHEVRYMDVGEDVDSDEGDMDNDEFGGKKEREIDLIEESDDDEGNADWTKKSEPEELSVGGDVGKKRKKDKVSKKKVLGVLKSEKSVVKKGVEEDLIEESDDDETKKTDEEEGLSVDGNVGKKRKKDKVSKKKVLGVLKSVFKKGMREDLSEESDDDETTKTEEELGLSVDGNVGKKRTKGKGSKKKVKPEMTVVKKAKKDGLLRREEPTEVKGKGKSERVVKKRVSAK